MYPEIEIVMEAPPEDIYEKLYISIVGGRQALGADVMQPTWSEVMAASALSVFPILIIFFFAQRLFIQGIMVSGVKG